jgi:hypothetical protein
MAEAPFFKLLRTPLSFVSCKSSCGASVCDADPEPAAAPLVLEFVPAWRASGTYSGKFVLLIWPIRQLPLFILIAVFGNPA